MLLISGLFFDGAPISTLFFARPYIRVDQVQLFTRCLLGSLADIVSRVSRRATRHNCSALVSRAVGPIAQIRIYPLTPKAGAEWSLSYVRQDHTRTRRHVSRSKFAAIEGNSRFGKGRKDPS